MNKAIALYSGGLDSLLSILIVKSQGFDVIALRFLTGFLSPLKERDIIYAKKFDFEIREIDIREKFIKILKNPKYGYGKNLNPCIDCKILMLKEAKKKLLEFNASFVITGEVLSQRPMSQKREFLTLIEKEANLQGLIWRLYLQNFFTLLSQKLRELSIEIFYMISGEEQENLRLL